MNPVFHAAAHPAARTRRSAEAAEMRFCVAPSALGAVLVARTTLGVSAILIGDEPGALEKDLRARFPGARLTAGDTGCRADALAVAAFIDDPAIGLDLPLDIVGTTFERRVWQAVRAVPRGTTISYSELARRIDAPRSTRAVARACAANPLALAIPCHRVVGRGGDLTGYRWGIERKRAVLDREARS